MTGSTTRVATTKGNRLARDYELVLGQKIIFCITILFSIDLFTFCFYISFPTGLFENNRKTLFPTDCFQHWGYKKYTPGATIESHGNHRGLESA